MKRLVAAFGLAALSALAAVPAQADPPLAGASLFANAQPFCASQSELLALLNAQIAHAPISAGAFPGCRYVDVNSLVTVTEDFPGRRYMHVVRARANLLFGTVDGYMFSVGLSPVPARSLPVHLNPFF